MDLPKSPARPFLVERSDMRSTKALAQSLSQSMDAVVSREGTLRLDGSALRAVSPGRGDLSLEPRERFRPSGRRDLDVSTGGSEASFIKPIHAEVSRQQHLVFGLERELEHTVETMKADKDRQGKEIEALQREMSALLATNSSFRSQVENSAKVVGTAARDENRRLP